MNLSTLKPAKGATRRNKRLGRGVGSGKGGHSSTRGNKGQKSRTGNHRMPSWFEGGQMPLQRRIPKFGFRNPNRVSYKVLNLAQLEAHIEPKTLDADAPITLEVLIEAGLIRKNDRVKILGDGELTTVLNIEVHAFSKSAEAKIQAAGGTITRLSAN
ncbi:MAG: 50S ribosomal protein L15 [Rhodothermaceae bacterium]|nr:50S ribosomal protein L15 [Rhodothermaceae bacterium]MYH08317.1 50S ribosomal protein L15 [Rhodothermaceae bacterium]